MGTQKSKPHSLQKDWQKVDTDNGIQIYKNRYNNQLAQKRIITIDSDDNIQDQLQVYNMRQNNRDALVRALCTKNLDKDSASSGLCSGHRKIFVFTQKMPHRLSECPQLTFPQSLLFMKQTLRAFERIYKEYGPVQITKDLIGINYLGEVKGWLNQNWALNHRGHQYLNIRQAKVADLTREQYLAFRGEYLDETQMVRMIISVIEQKCQDGKFPQAFKEQVENQSGSFKKLSLYLRDFIDYNEISVPDRINYENLVHNNYRLRLQHQLNPNSQNLQQTYSQANNTNGFGANRSQQYGMGSQFNNQDSLKGMLTQQNVYHMNGQAVGQNTIRPNFPPSLSDKQSPASDTLGHVTFSQSNRTYNGQSNLQVSSKKNIGYGQSLSYPTGGNSYQWSNQGLSKQYNQQLNGSYGIGSIQNRNPTTTESKYQFYNSTGYQPYQSSSYESSRQPLAFESTLVPAKLQSSLNSFNGANGDVQGSKYSYNYSSSYADTNKLSGYGNSSNTNNHTLSSNVNTLNKSSHFNLPISTSYSNNYTSGYQPSLNPTTTQLNTINSYSKSSTFQQRVQGGQRLGEYSSEQKVRQIDGKTGQLIDNNTGGVFAISKLKMDNSRDGTIVQTKDGQHYQAPDTIGYGNTIGYVSSYGSTGVGMESSKWGNLLPTQTYTHTSTLHMPTQLREQPITNTSTQTISTYSFGSNLDNVSKFGTGYIGTGYSNNLTKYQPSASSKTQSDSLSSQQQQHSTLLANNLNLEGKYAEAFTSLLSPKLTGIIGQQNMSTLNNIQSEHTQVNTNITNKSTPTSIDKQKPLSTNQQTSPITHPEITHNQQGLSNNTNAFQGFSNIVERVSNEVSESVLRQA